ncbi:MAG: HAD family hydrolase [Planctomycetota bacterium]
MHDLLAESGFERFYDLGGGRGRPIGASPKRSDQSWIEPLEAACATCVGEGEVVVRTSIDIQGVHCAACVWLLQEVWRRCPGGVRFELNPSLGRAEIAYRRESHTLAAFVARAESFGYRVGPAGKVADRSDRALLLRLGVCAALAMNAMLFAFALYSGMSAADGASFALFHWLSCGLATAAVAIGGPVFFRAALAGLRQRVLHFDLPISLGILLAYGSSVVLFATGWAAPYFDTVTVFVALMLAGRFVQQRAVRRNRDILLANDGAEHLRARRVEGDTIDQVPVRSLKLGDRLLLVPGDLLPVDARLIDREAALSLDWILGESRARTFAAGDEIPAGAFLAGRRAIHVQVLRDAEASGLLRLLATPRRNADGLRGRERFWDLVNRGYVAAVLTLAVLASAVWAFIDPLRAAQVATAVLVVTCPCALGLATPLAFDMAVASLRRRGIFVRDAALLEKARHVRKVVFDKTGTLTWGGVCVRPLREVAPENRDLLFTLATSSNHPVSEAIAQFLRQSGPVHLLQGLGTEESIGEGLRAEVDGVECRLGSPAFTLGDAPDARGESTCLFTRGGRVEAAFVVDEDFRSGADQELRELRDAGLRVLILSGDRDDRVQRAASTLGIPAEDARGGLRPQDKARVVAEIDAADTMVVGDGLNDAPAFEAAFCAGTPALDRPVMPERADFFYTGVGTGAVTRVLHSARRFHSVVRRNLWLAGIYNAAAVSLAVAGAMTPLLCAVLMPLSSVVLIVHTVSSFGEAGKP